jgi:hypothetical protein
MKLGLQEIMQRLFKRQCKNVPLSPILTLASDKYFLANLLFILIRLPCTSPSIASFFLRTSTMSGMHKTAQTTSRKTAQIRENHSFGRSQFCLGFDESNCSPAVTCILLTPVLAEATA